MPVNPENQEKSVNQEEIEEIDTLNHLNKSDLVDEMMRVAKLLEIGDDQGFNPDSFQVMMNLLDKDLSYLVVLQLWYRSHKNHPIWQSFFDQAKMGWLWALYKDKNEENLDKLCNYLLGTAQTA